MIFEGLLGCGIMPFAGNYYIAKRYLKAGRFSAEGVQGLRIYRLLRVSLRWMYRLPNPALPLIWFGVAFSGSDKAF